MDSFVIFDWIIFAITGFLSVWFLTGHGEKIIKAFDGGSQNMVRRKMSPEQKAKFLRACGVFCLVLCVTGLLLALFHGNRIVPFLAIGVALADIIVFALYSKKHFPPDSRF